MSIRNLLIAFFMLPLPIVATPQTLRNVNMNYEASYNPPAKDYLAANFPLKFDGRFEVRYLLGEPVVNCTARWLNNEQLSVNTPSGDNITAQPGDAEVYNLMLVAQLWDPERNKKRFGHMGGHIAAFCDAGIVAQNGENGFNVAGSPNWDKFLCNLPSKFYKRSASPFAAEIKQGDLCEEAGGSWFSAEAAKTMAQAGLKFEDVTIKSLEVNVGATIRRYEKEQWRGKSFAYKASKASAIGERMRQKSYTSPDALSEINYMHMKKGGQTATPTLLKEYDEVLTTLQNRLQDGGAFAAEWREKDQTLVREQLAHVRAIEHDLLREEAKLADYKKKLEQLKVKNADRAPPEPLFTVFRTNKTDLGACGLKRQDGSVFLSTSGYQCYGPEDTWGFYSVSGKIGDQYCVIVVSDAGEKLVNLCGSSGKYQKVSGPSHLGLIFIDSHVAIAYSLEKRRFLFNNPTGQNYEGQPLLIKRNNRFAIKFRDIMTQCASANHNSVGARVFYLDNEKFEETYCIGSPESQRTKFFDYDELKDIKSLY